MANADDVVSGDTLDLILDWLDEEVLDEEFEGEFEREVEEVATITGLFYCSSCSKTYKPKGGLARHENTKHKPSAKSELDWEQFCSILSNAQQALADDKCFSDAVRRNIAVYQLAQTEKRKIISSIQAMYRDLYLTGNAEEFYSLYYSKVIFNYKEFFQNLEQPLCSLFAKRLGDKLFAVAKNPVQGPVEKPPPITVKEMAGLQYLSGYVVKKLLKASRSDKNYQKEEHQLIIKVLTTMMTDDYTDQSLIEATSRGGLTAVNVNMQHIVKTAEEKFRLEASINSLQRIDTCKMTECLMRDMEVISVYDNIIQQSGTDINKETKDNILEKMLTLYLRVRAFSLAKDLTGKHCAKIKAKRAKSLRKTIKKATDKPVISERHIHEII